MITEAEVGKIIEVAKRLDEKYPFLAQRGSLVESIQPRYTGVIERVEYGQHDVKGSLLGCEFLDDRKTRLVEDPAGSLNSGLAQIDLDEVAKITGRNVGSGLLQVFMEHGYWDSGSHLGSLFVRAIPRNIVDRIDTTYYDDEAIEDDIQMQADIDKLRETDPYEAERRLYLHHYEMGCAGFDWLLSTHLEDDYDSIPHQISDYGAPLQIVGWERAGYEMPNPCLFYSEDFDEGFNEGFGIDDIYPSFPDDPDVKIMIGAMEDRLPDLRLGLFASNYDDPYEIEQHPELGWKPLLSFDGPVSRAAVDVHTVFYRQTGEEFEYCGACIRYKS